MSLNWKEIELILEGLKLNGSHIQKIKQPDYQSLIFEVYKPSGRFSFIISLGQGKTRIHSLTKPAEKAEKLQRFAQFLRSRILGGKIIQAVQIQQDRIIKFSIMRGGEETFLWIRLWGGAANIIATDPHGHIFDAFYRRPKRGEISGGYYNPEKDSDKHSKTGQKTYEVRVIPGEGSFNSKIEDFYYNLKNNEVFENIRLKVEKFLLSKEISIVNSISRLKEKLKTYESCEQYKQYGDLIISHLSELKTGDKWLSAKNYYRNDEIIEIDLDPEITPEKNAEKYYRKYKKSKTGLQILKKEISNQKQALLKLNKEKEKLLNEDNIDILNNYLKTRQKKTIKDKEKTPGLLFTSEDFNILIGRTAKENDILLRKHVRGNDLWLHTRDYPGAYVFIKTIPGKSIPLDVLLDAGNLALFYSKGKTGGAGELYYTRVKYLRRAKNGKPGLVLPTHEKNLSIKLDQSRIDRIQNK